MVNVMLAILSILWFVSLLDILLHYLHIRGFGSSLPELTKNLYPKVLYQRYIKKEKRDFIFDSLKSILRVLLYSLGMMYRILHDWYGILSSWYGQGIFVDILFLVSILLGMSILEFLVDFMKKMYASKNMSSKRNRTSFLHKKLKRYALRFVLVTSGAFLIFSMYAWLGRISLLVLYMFVMVLIILLSVFFTEWIIPFFHTIKVIEEGELKEEISIFLRQEGYQIRNVYVLKGSFGNQLNAFVSGFSKGKRIVLFEGLMKRLRNDEIIAVLAHELGHQKRKHLVVNLALSFAFVGGFFIGLDLVMQGGLWLQLLGIESYMYGIKFLLYIMLLEGYVMVGRFALASNSKRFEFQADQYAKKVWYKSSLRSALIKIAKRNMEHLTPHPIYEMLYFTHPSLVNRLEKLNQEDD